jgi:hypothetical protein
MTPIRPGLPPILAPAQPVQTARPAGMRAFFEIAAGAAPPAPAAAPAPVQTPELPSRPLRPGSLLDIRV